MLKINLILIGLIFLTITISCRSFMATKSVETATVPTIDFTSPGKPLDVKVQLDSKRTSSGNITPAGGTISLTSADGSKFTLDVPAGAVEADTIITMTAIKSLTGAPLDGTTPAAVQLEPSGSVFKEFLTLTVVPGKEIPIKQQVAFGYEGEGKDYHLALVDPKSKEVKIKLMGFSGAGVGSATDAAWAVNLALQGETARTRLTQKAGEILQRDRIRQLLGEESESNSLDSIKNMMDQYDDQVVRKEIAAAELDCRFARRTMQTILGVERQRQLLGFDEQIRQGPWEQIEKLMELARECKKPAAFQIVGGLDYWQTSTKVCDILQPFDLTGGGFKMHLSGGLAGTYSYTGPYNANGTGTYTISLPEGLDKPGTMTGQGKGEITGDKVYTGSGVEKYTLTPIEPCS